ncbi:tyrosine-type recombinase/integrase [Verrucomicrobiaceae bacterium 5K15]|uniref:Tyrosine-type recombinase/integrase n=1 Tax=Oceaniferula flava TaxID=2800421 RepID=A0AAE2S9G9_9BACT|nr:tyrosine-type recombinase/integrase [Oceaniferula flavus]MBK1853696.1 tyrosine-type recombinase/integrase [Oceaniferula flavus]MBM1135002.1 tyrosine-type recombinase/integrase [Oceaniferula flavus]
MPRTPRFDYRKTSKGWLVNVPASASDTGKFRRRYFSTRDEAKAEAKRLREAANGTRAKAIDIRADLAADAIKASELLSEWGISLTQAAMHYIEHHDTRSKAPTLCDAWTAGLKHRENHRPRTLADFRAWEKALPEWFMSMNCHDITADDIQKALDETTDGQTRWKNGMRNISAILGDVVKSGAIEKNPVKAMKVKRNPESSDEVTTYTPKELKALFAACVDYPEGETDRLCSGCAMPFAFMAFAGIRPEEVTKLRWENVSLELGNIRIDATIAKKLYRRNVRIQPTLEKWIESIPAKERVGKIIPPRWRFKAAKVRSKAGIDGREKQDALRHSFGSYLLATEGDLDALKSDMGHGHMSTFFDHYHKAFTKREALPYWQVLPAGAKLSNISAVV